MFVRCLSPSSAHTAARNLLTNSVLLSATRNVGIPYGMSQWFMNAFATCVAVVFDVKTARASKV